MIRFDVLISNRYIDIDSISKHNSNGMESGINFSSKVDYILEFMDKKKYSVGVWDACRQQRGTGRRYEVSVRNAVLLFNPKFAIRVIRIHYFISRYQEFNSGYDKYNLWCQELSCWYDEN